MKARNCILYILSAAVMALAAGCIKNDIPYPRIHANFLTFNAEGQDTGTAIDSVNRVVTLTFGESVDITRVVVTDYTITPGAEVVGDALASPVDLSSPLYVTLRLYQDWDWVIRANQTIQRYFSVEGQVGSTTIDVPGRRVVAYVAKNQPIDALRVTSIKLGAEGSTLTPDLTAPGLTVDFTHPVEVEVTQWGHTATWTIYVEQVDATVVTERVDAWTCVAWVYGQAEAGRDNGIEYRLQGDEQWTRVPGADIVTEGGSFHACIPHLQPLTTYEARAYSGTDYGAALTFTTGSAPQVPNESLDSWWLDGKVWCPWAEGGEPYWDTGNKGATTIGASNSIPTDETSTGTGWAAKLQTVFAGIGPLGKLAAGNLFVGSYVRTDGTNGVLSFGREFTDRPTRLRGYLKYTTAPISHTSTGFEYLKDRPDTCIVWCALIDQDTPFEIRTNPRNRQLFDPQGSYVVAYGSLQYGENIGEYIPFDIELDYRSTSRVPKYLLITASASKYGDYFTGGVGAILWLDDLSLEYDY